MINKSMRTVLVSYLTVGVFMLNFTEHTQAAEVRQEVAEPQSISQKNAVSTMEIPATVVKPTTLIELLQNIKFALDHHLTLNKDFYTDENLRRLFGAKNIYWRKNDLTKQFGGFAGLEQRLNATKEESKLNDGISLDFNRKVKENGQTHVEIGLNILWDHPPNFDAIEKIFGVNWHQARQRMRRGHEAPLLRSTQPHGHAHIEYLVETAESKLLIDLEFDHNASLRHARFIEEK